MKVRWGIFGAVVLMYRALRPLLVESVKRTDTQFDDRALQFLDDLLGLAEVEMVDQGKEKKGG